MAEAIGEAGLGKKQRGNVLLITLDQWRWDCLGAMGHPIVQTPHLDSLAADGALFTRHYAQASPCGPARASLLTGLYLHNHRLLRNGIPLADRHTNVAREARRLGYDPVLFGYTDTAVDPRLYPASDPALTTYEGVLPGFTTGLLLPESHDAWRAHLQALGYQLPAKPKDVWLPAGARPPGKGVSFAPPMYRAEESETAFLADAVIRHLSVQSQAWFLHVSFLRPHPPYIAPAPFNAMYPADWMPPPVRHASPEEEGRQHPWLEQLIRRKRGGMALVQHPVRQADLSEADELQIRATYLGMVSQVDEQIGRIVAALKARGNYETTLIIVTADHGDQLGDHWLYGKDAYFDSTFHVPLIIRDPGASAEAKGSRVKAWSEAIDIMPTILDWLGGEVPAACDGHSLLALCSGNMPGDWRREVHMGYDFRDIRDPYFERAFGLKPEQCGVLILQDDNGKYVHFAGMEPLFFDLRNDPGELLNCAGDPAYGERLRDYAQRLLSWRMQHEDKTLSHLHLGAGGVVSRLVR